KNPERVCIGIDIDQVLEHLSIVAVATIQLLSLNHAGRRYSGKVAPRFGEDERLREAGINDVSEDLRELRLARPRRRCNCGDHATLSARTTRLCLRLTSVSVKR